MISDKCINNNLEVIGLGNANIVILDKSINFQSDPCRLNLLRLRLDGSGSSFNSKQVIDYLNQRILPNLYISCDDITKKNTNKNNILDAKYSNEALHLKVIPMELENLNHGLVTFVDKWLVNKKGRHISDQKYCIKIPYVTVHSNSDNSLFSYTSVNDALVKITKSEFLVEFKPKWLAPSPNAPIDAKYCRTCAVRQMRNKSRNVCPLSLLDENSSKEAFLDLISIPPLISNSTDLFKIFDRYTDILAHYTSTCLRELKDLQVKFDKNGVLSIDKNDNKLLEKLSLSMTFRDCTLFIHIKDLDMRNPDNNEKNGFLFKGNKYTVCNILSDVDPKDWNTKYEYWANLEKKLIKEGWYYQKKSGVEWESSCF